MASSIYGLICLTFLFSPIPTRGKKPAGDQLKELFPSVEHARKYVEASIKPERKLQVLTCNDGEFNEFYENLLFTTMNALRVDYEIVDSLSSYKDVFDATGEGRLNETHEVDLMFCAHFLTHDRLNKGVTFAVPIMEKGTIILMARGQGHVRGYNPLLAFQPFDPLVWLAFGALVVISSMAIWCFENDSDDFRRTRVSARGALMLRTVMSGAFSLNSGNTGLGTYLYELSTGLFQVNWISAPRSSGTKVLMFGFSFVSIAFAASYIAQLTVFLENSYKLRNDVPQTWGELVDPRYKICIPQGTFLAENAMKTHTAVNFLNVSGVDDGMEALKSNKCNGLLYDTPVMELKQKKICNGELLPKTASPLIPYVVGFHVNSPWVDLVAALSTVFVHMRTAKFSGKIEYLEDMYHISFRAKSIKCHASQIGLTPDSIEIRQMTGLFALHGFFILVSGILHVCRRGVPNERKTSDGSFASRDSDVSVRNSDVSEGNVESHDTSGSAELARVEPTAQVQASESGAEVPTNYLKAADMEVVDLEV